ncbi:MAG TPA: DUF3168 domain-containing protein [Hypericibacter adhaerens]|uniref:DUF3168 domain-containing protein n=1 Tax=Hypericibacter adhaerens TaxID=2602016 RepID=UPI002CB0FA21|nr:DUF3168 domain-containing protein [Hypericibacter adhaerens]HWA42161.1 DUF3168 domain-containing protein [Hypericibacter adhaerens]
MTHPILALQSTLVAALRLAGVTVFDAPPQGALPPYVSIARHDVLPRDGDEAPAHEHRLLLHAWTAEASRKSAVALAEAVLSAALAATLDSAGLVVTLRRHDRTDTAIDPATGWARAAIAMTFYSEPGD